MKLSSLRDIGIELSKIFGYHSHLAKLYSESNVSRMFLKYFILKVKKLIYKKDFTGF